MNTLYIYTQNNSGGYYDGPRMIAVAAKNEKRAIFYAEEIGLDLDADYCECCGQRWSTYADEIEDNQMDRLAEKIKAYYWLFDLDRKVENFSNEKVIKKLIPELVEKKMLAVNLDE